MNKKHYSFLNTFNIREEASEVMKTFLKTEWKIVNIEHKETEETFNNSNWIECNLSNLRSKWLVDCRVVVHRGLWQYGLWSFQTGGTKLKIFLPKNQHTQRKQKCSPKLIFFLKFFLKDSDNFWHRKLTLKVRNQNFSIATCQTYVDLPKNNFYGKVLFFIQLSCHLMRKLLKKSWMVSNKHATLTVLFL